MSVEVMAWNVLDAFSDEVRAQGVLNVVKEQNPDAAVFAEAWQERKGGLVDAVVAEFESCGYAVTHGLYDDTDGRRDRHGIMGIVRNARSVRQAPGIVRLGNRNAVYLPLSNPASGDVYDMYGIHLDDRTEERRLEQTRVLLDMTKTYIPTIIAGDLNAMHGDDLRAKALRAVRPIAEHLPSVDPDPDVEPPTFLRMGSLAGRLTVMAAGTTIQAFEAADFADADPAHKPTKGPVQLDHIMYRGLVACAQQTHDKSALSDHRAISARFQHPTEDGSAA